MALGHMQAELRFSLLLHFDRAFTLEFLTFLSYAFGLNPTTESLCAYSINNFVRSEDYTDSQVSFSSFSGANTGILVNLFRHLDT